MDVLGKFLRKSAISWNSTAQGGWPQAGHSPEDFINSSLLVPERLTDRGVQVTSYIGKESLAQPRSGDVESNVKTDYDSLSYLHRE